MPMSPMAPIDKMPLQYHYLSFISTDNNMVFLPDTDTDILIPMYRYQYEDTNLTILNKSICLSLGGGGAKLGET